MPSMIDKVADALAERFMETVSNSAGMSFLKTGVSLPNREVWLAYARAAVEAMYEPSPKMLDERHGTFVAYDGDGGAYIDEDNATKLWQSMIRIALEGEDA